MRSLTSMFAAACFVASSGVALAASPTFTTIDNPGDPTFNQLLAISNTGIIAGYFGSGQAGHPNQAYTIQPPYTSFSRFVVPGAVQTQATALFDTTTVGFWSGTNMGMLNGAPQDANYGFVREKLPSGQYQWILVNDKTSSFPAMANLLGINGAMNAVGFYADSNGLSHGFAYNVTTGVYTAVTISGAKQVAATGINASNLIAGFYVDGAQVTHAFLASLSGGAPIRFTVPGAQVTQFFGVNDSGEAVGSYTLDGVIHGLLYNPANGLWQTLDYPNAVEAPGSGTVINGLNNKGQAVGFYNDAAGNTHGMLINNAF